MANFHEEKNYNKQYKVLRFPPIFYINGRIKIIEFSNIQILPGLKAKLLLISIVYSNKIYNRVMRSGNGNKNSPPKVSWSHKQKKTTLHVCLISKKKTLHVQHTFFFTFLCHCFTLLQRETSRNILVSPFLLANVVRCFSCSLFFSMPLIFTFMGASTAFLIFSPLL